MIHPCNEIVFNDKIIELSIYGKKWKDQWLPGVRGVAQGGEMNVRTTTELKVSETILYVTVMVNT